MSAHFGFIVDCECLDKTLFGNLFPANPMSRAELTTAGVRMLIEVPDDRGITPGADGTVEITLNILDVMEPPAARERWLKYRSGAAKG